MVATLVRSWKTFVHSRYDKYSSTETHRASLARRNNADTICTAVQKLLKPKQLEWLDVGLGQFTTKKPNPNRALTEGLKLVHGTPMTSLPGGLLPKTFKMEDAQVPERAVGECWFSSGVNRAVEHTLDGKFSAFYANGMKIIAVGPGAQDNYHAKIIAFSEGVRATTVGCDYLTTVGLPAMDDEQPWNLGPDTLVISISSPVSPQPWDASILHNGIITGARADAALQACNAFYDAQPAGCSFCYWVGCDSCNKRGIEARLADIAPKRYEHGSYPLVGKRFRKLFADGVWYEGVAKSVKRGLYRIEYDDGDAEDVLPKTLKANLTFLLIE
jgi:hypothetical protein